VQVLDACPLCRTAVKPGDTRCPDCGADLAPYADLKQLARHYLELAREYINRGESAPARLIIERIPQVTSDAGAELAELRVLVAIHEGDLDNAQQGLKDVPAEVREVLEHTINQAREARFMAHELYNLALSAARNGAMHTAAQHLELAVGYDPADPAIWALKLKVDLKCGYYRRCYDTLAKLDRLAARPPEFHGLESLLPPA